MVRFLDNNMFLTSLYDDIPSLNDVTITQFRVNCAGDRVELVFDMPLYATNPPKKWQEHKCNTVIVRIDFDVIRLLDVNLKSTRYIGDIDVFTDENELINLKITGDIDVNLLAEFAFVQKVEGYCYDSMI